MAFKDVLLPLSSYPEATPVPAIEQAVGLAGVLGAHISALTCKIEIPNVVNVLANKLLDVPGMIAAERQKSMANAQALISAFKGVATKRGVPHEQIIESCPTSLLAAIVTEHARMHDVTMIPAGGQADLQQYVAECVIFGSGRPTIVFPEVSKRGDRLSFDVVGVAWDFSRPAARAVADALPILQLAKTVRVVTITKEKTIDTRRSATELAKHLTFHGIEVVLEEEDAAGRTIGQALEGYATAHDLDLLVMGAYGHSRLRDFILGGATKSIVANPTLPVLLSH
ncbi:MAG: universal stress protein [Rhodospirillaceae bacterium]|nr:universal stress protein [Rhodospirillaceae bacterium]